MKKLFKKISEWVMGLENRRLKRKAIEGLMDSYKKNYQVELILEQWIIKRILDGRKERRKELAEKQARIKEMTEFMEYLKGL